MQDLRVIALENGVLTAAADDGTRYRITIDDETQAKLRRRSPVNAAERKVGPREIQSHIRAGMSAQDVADLTGAELDYVERFEGPVLAEREFIVTASRSVPVNTAADVEPLGGSTFGSAIDERLDELGASDIAWASWKDPESGWVVKLTFTANSVSHDARWQFDPKKSTLAPTNSDATTLSQQGELPGSLIPRLRAVTDTKSPDTSRFDSGAFTDEQLSQRDTSPYGEAIPFMRSGISPAAVNRDAAEDASGVGHTADLLEALRRRRGERESAPSEDSFDEAKASHPSTGSIRVIDVPLSAFDDNSPSDSPSPAPPAPVAPTVNSTPGLSKPARKGRASMPSWDDIVFGAKSDDD